MKTLDEVFEYFWSDYSMTTPDAKRIRSLFEARGERVVNDHVALRTFDLAPIQMEALAAPFVALGYRESGRYAFEDKKLDAISFSHPSGNYPRLFVSQLRTRAFSSAFQETVRGLVSEVDGSTVGAFDFFARLPTWRSIDYATYERLLAESEYGAWLVAFGVRVNHFTVSFNALKTFSQVADLNAWLKTQGFALNTSGGEVKGSAAVLLEQSSTVASRVEVAFADTRRVIPSCYYEFAKRYTDPSTEKLYDGFVEKNADRIFESTNVRA